MSKEDIMNTITEIVDTIERNPYNLNFPPFGTYRPSPWIYAGWIRRNPEILTYDELKERALEDVPGQVRELDEYPEGAICWYRKV